MVFERININHEKMGGLPCIRDLRIPVSTVCDAGIDATQARDEDRQHATDLRILDFARHHAFVIVSEDTDSASCWLSSAQ